MYLSSSPREASVEDISTQRKKRKSGRTVGALRRLELCFCLCCWCWLCRKRHSGGNSRAVDWSLKPTPACRRHRHNRLRRHVRVIPLKALSVNYTLSFYAYAFAFKRYAIARENVFPLLNVHKRPSSGTNFLSGINHFRFLFRSIYAALGSGNIFPIPYTHIRTLDAEEPLAKEALFRARNMYLTNQNDCCRS